MSGQIAISAGLIERDFIARAVVELGGARGFVRGDGLGVLDGSAVLQVGRDAGGAEGVAAGGEGESGVVAAPFDNGDCG